MAFSKLPIVSENARLGDRKVFTADGSYSKPTGLKFIIVELVGGGGAGGGAAATGAADAAISGGGGAGGYTQKKILAEDLAASESITIGLGGTGVTGTNGNNGGTTSFGAHCSATGGTGGSSNGSTSGPRVSTGRSGGVGQNGDVNMEGGGGSPGHKIIGTGATTEPVVSGSGGTAPGPWGGGGGYGGAVQKNSAGGDGAAGGNYGGGGGGSANGESRSAKAGANGADGIVVVWEFY